MCRVQDRVGCGGGGALCLDTRIVPRHAPARVFIKSFFKSQCPHKVVNLFFMIIIS